MYKCGLQTFAKNQPRLRQVKQIIIDELLTSGDINEAYQMSKSINDYERCLKIVTSSMDTKKIKECLESLEISHEERVKKAR